MSAADRFPSGLFRVLQVGPHIVMTAGKNEDNHIRPAFKEKTKIDAGAALEKVFSEPANVHASVEMRPAKGFSRRSHGFRNRL
jgi:hypothetical protein